MSGWDCHAHVFGPYADYPLAADRSYTPPEATAAQFAGHLRRLGLSRGVLVHPSAYGDDPSLLLDVLASRPDWRGVVVTRADASAPLAAWRAAGIRGARFSHRSGGGNFAGSASLDDLVRLATPLADAGLHAELWTDGGVLPHIAATLGALPVPLVIDHMGGFDWRAGVDAPGFSALVSLLRTGRVWVKLCAYRNLLDAPDPGVGRPFQARLVDTDPTRLVWGSDWPHLRVDPAPEAADLLAIAGEWLGDEALLRRVLVDNPARLYD